MTNASHGPSEGLPVWTCLVGVVAVRSGGGKERGTILGLNAR